MEFESIFGVSYKTFITYAFIFKGGDAFDEPEEIKSVIIKKMFEEDVTVDFNPNEVPKSAPHPIDKTITP